MSENPTYLDLIAEVLVEQYPQLADKIDRMPEDFPPLDTTEPDGIL